MPDGEIKQSKKILFAEDDLFLLELYTMGFTQAGYTIVSATDGEKAYELIKSTQGLDLILLDITLPKMDGLTVLNKLKSEGVTVSAPICMFSNLGEDSVIAEAMKLGAIGYLIKANFTPQQLSEKIGNYFATGAI